MIPTLIDLGPVAIHSFGLMMVCAFLAAYRLLYLSLERGGERKELAEPMCFWAAVGGILGARLGYVFTVSDTLWSDPFGTIFSAAGFVFHWGFLGGWLAVYILSRKEKFDMLRYGDLAAAALAVGYAVGRIGCQLSGDGDYGKVSDLPWAMGYPLGVIPTPTWATVHPTPVYETLFALLLAVFLVLRERRMSRERRGEQFGVFLMCSAVFRFVVEIVRIEPVVFMGLTQAQVICVGLFVIGAGFVVNARRGSKNRQ